MHGERLQTQLNYWKQQLSNAPPILELPSRPRPLVQSSQGKSLSFTLNKELKQQLQTLTKNTGTTLFMTLLAAFATLLYRYSGQEDINIGSPIANRNRSEIEPLIGSFVNTLVLRIRIQDNPSFAELLTQVQQVALDAYEHQDAPFEKVVEALQPERNLSHNPLFQVMFALQNTPMGKLELPSLSLTPLALKAVTSKFDITLSIEEKEEGLTGSWEYSGDLFDEATIARMAENFQVLLEAIATLFQFPTIEDLANHLKTNKDTPSSSNLVPIQPKGDKTPLFCVHPVGGDVLCYADLAHYLGDTQPFWAWRSLGIQGECEPLTKIEDMAATYIKALQTIQPVPINWLVGLWAV